MNLSQLSTDDLQALKSNDLSKVSTDGLKKLKTSSSESKPAGKSFGEKAFEFVEPTAEALGTAGGAMLGSALGPLGTVGGAGLGYGMTKEALQLGKQALGYEKPRQGMQNVSEPIKNVLTGATYEAGGRALPEFLSGAGKLGSSVVDYFKTPKAAKIAGEALGPNLQQAREALKRASGEISAGQALSEINAPTAQALLKRAEAHDPEFFTKMFGDQEAKRLQTLERIAGGSNQTEARAAQEEMKKQLNETLIPKLKIELNAANTAGKLKPKFGAEAGRMEQAATNKVQDVRRMVAAGERATKKSPLWSPTYMGDTRAGFPAPYRELPSQWAERYTYAGDLAKKADQFADQAAEASLRFGEAGRFSRAAEESLAAHGLRPLTSDSVVQAIASKAKDPSIAGNKDLERALTRVAGDVRKWTNGGGVIDAFALDSIRKNSVNQVAKDLFKDDLRAQKRFAAKVLDSVRPAIVDAIESAGGTGYRQYLEDYAKGSQTIAQKEMGAKLLDVYKSSPKKFKELVEGNDPQEIEKVFGPGKYNLFTEMSANALNQLGGVAKEIGREEAITSQAGAGQTRLADILGTKMGIVPRLTKTMFGYKAAGLPEILNKVEGSVSKSAMKQITEAAKSAKGLDDLLSKLPQPVQSEMLNAIKPSRAAGGVIAGTDQ